MALTGLMPGDPPEVDRHLHGLTGRVAYDVGANQGGYTQGMLHRFDHVVACEPAVESFAVLQGLACDQLTALNVAVTDHDGWVKLNVQSESIKSGQLTTDSGGDGLETHTWGATLGTRLVPAVTLDELVRRHGRPDLVKVDVEGHEVPVIRGGLASILEYKPALYLEIHHGGFGDEIRDLLAPAYPGLRQVFHPHYPDGHWGRLNHYWLISA